MHFWALNQFDRDFVEFLERELDMPSISFEQVCSGRGLVNIYKFISHRKGLLVDRGISGKYITDNSHHPGECREAVQYLIDFLGRFISQICLIFKPFGGIYISGTVIKSVETILNETDYFKKGLCSQYHPVLHDIVNTPTIRIVHREDLGLLGAQKVLQDLNK